MKPDRRAADEPAGASFTAAEGRRFGLTVGLAFLALGGILVWRDHRLVAAGAGVLGFLLVLGGSTVPSRLGPLFRSWMALARAISRVTTPLFLGLVYFLVITPAGWLRRTLSTNPLERADRDGSYWVDRAENPRSDLRRQF